MPFSTDPVTLPDENGEPETWFFVKTDAEGNPLPDQREPHVSGGASSRMIISNVGTKSPKHFDVLWVMPAHSTSNPSELHTPQNSVHMIFCKGRFSYTSTDCNQKPLHSPKAHPTRFSVFYTSPFFSMFFSPSKHPRNESRCMHALRQG